MAMLEGAELEAFARDRFDVGIDLDIPAYALAELQTILKQNPNDTLFTIKRDPGKGYGTAICQEAGCKNKQIPLISNGKAPGGGKDFGFGSVVDFLHHQKESPKHYRSRKERLKANGIVEEPNLAPKATQSASTSANASQVIKVKPEPDNDSSNPISSGQKRKPPAATTSKGFILIDDSSSAEDGPGADDDDDIEFVASKPAAKKSKVDEPAAASARAPSSIFKGVALGRNPSDRSIRDEAKPIISSSSSSPARAHASLLSPKLTAQRSLPEIEGSSPSGRIKTAAEIALAKEERIALEKTRLLRMQSRADPENQDLARQLLEAQNELGTIEGKIKRLREGKARFSSTEGEDDDEDLPDLSNILGRPAPATASSFSLSKKDHGEARANEIKPKAEPKPENDENVNARPPAVPGAFPAQPPPPVFARGPAAYPPVPAAFRFDAPLFQPGMLAAAQAGPVPQMPGQFAGGFPVMDAAAQVQALRAQKALQDRIRDQQLKAAGPSNSAGLPRDPERTLRNEDDAGGSSDEEEHRTRVEGILAGHGGPIEAGRLAAFFEEEIGGHDFNEGGQQALENALDSLRLKQAGDKLPHTNIQLYPHQLLGVSWMLAQEKSKYKGGLLADEMGLGKTVQMISVICLNRADPKERKEASTLIIAPVALLDQWKKEIENKSKGSLSVYTYHGPNKSSSKNELRKHDVVLTTSTTLALGWVQDDEVALNRAKKKWRTQNQGATWTEEDGARWYHRNSQISILFKIRQSDERYIALYYQRYCSAALRSPVCHHLR